MTKKGDKNQDSVYFDYSNMDQRFTTSLFHAQDSQNNFAYGSDDDLIEE